MWIWFLAAFSGFFVKGLCGFANTLVFTTILGFGENNVDISPVELLISFPANVILLWKNRAGLRTSVWLVPAVLVLLGDLPGALLLKAADAGYIKIVFGVVLIAAGVENILRDRESAGGKKTSGLGLAVVGVLSGLLCGLFGVGALMAAYVGRMTSTSEEFKANVTAIFIVDNIFRFILYTYLGVVDLHSAKIAFILMPAVLAGLFSGMWSGRFLDEKAAKRLVVILLMLSGAALIFKNI